MPDYIDDGYTREDGYVAAAPESKSGERLHGALEFSYRVATRSEVIRHDAEVRRTLGNDLNDPEAAIKAEGLACKFVADRVKSWNLKNRGNHLVPVTADACSRMNGSLFGRLYSIVRGNSVSDPKPPAEVSPPSDEDNLKNSETVSG